VEARWVGTPNTQEKPVKYTECNVLQFEYMQRASQIINGGAHCIEDEEWVFPIQERIE
jgi:hypothetical protein